MKYGTGGVTEVKCITEGDVDTIIVKCDLVYISEMKCWKVSVSELRPLM